jgi:hypothetical protein
MGELTMRMNDLAEAQIKTEERFRETDQRVAALVSAIGELIRASRPTPAS